MKSLLIKNLSSCIFFCLAIYSCNSSNNDISIALNLAGKNKDELNKVIEYYERTGDKQKLEAANFLIANMPGKKYTTYLSYDSLGNPINSDTISPKFKYIRFSDVEDIKTIKANYLIENIEYAFKAWDMPWAKHLSFDEFCEYLLPYRYGNEPLCNWRKKSFEQMQWVLDSITTNSSTLHVCQTINNSLKKYYSFKHYDLVNYPGLLSYEQAKIIKGGRCEDLNMIGAYLMRSIGVPVASEFTPTWSNSNFGGHDWLSVYIENKKFIPFNVAYDNPSLSGILPFKDNILCKAYRRKYENNKETFVKSHKNMEYFPKYLINQNFYDVTKELISAKNYDIPLIVKSIPNSLAYIGVLSGYGWQAVDTAKVSEERKMIYAKNLGFNTIYIAYNQDKNIIKYLSHPFFIDEKGKIKYLIGNGPLNNFSINFKRDYWWLRKDRRYVIARWENNNWKNATSPIKWNGNTWVPLPDFYNVKVRNDSILNFSGIPSNCLMRIENVENIDDIGSYGRPFLIINNNVITH